MVVGHFGRYGSVLCDAFFGLNQVNMVGICRETSMCTPACSLCMFLLETLVVYFYLGADQLGIERTL